MGFLAELLLLILVAAAEILFELLAQVAFELLAEFGLRSLAEPLRRPRPIHPFLAAFGYATYGSLAGALSLLVFPQLLIESPSLRLANLLITPVLCGVLMAAKGSARRRKNKELTPFDSFLYGFIFAFAMALVRFAWL